MILRMQKSTKVYILIPTKKPQDLINRGGYDSSENESENDDDNLLGKSDEDIDEEELAEVLDGEDCGITVS